VISSSQYDFYGYAQHVETVQTTAAAAHSTRQGEKTSEWPAPSRKRRAAKAPRSRHSGDESNSAAIRRRPANDQPRKHKGDRARALLFRYQQRDQ